MRFIVHAIDKPEALPRRMSAIEVQRAYLDRAPAAHGLKVLLSGPLTDDEGQTMIGAFFLLDAPDRNSVEAFFAGNPLNCADVWENRTVKAANIRQDKMT